MRLTREWKEYPQSRIPGTITDHDKGRREDEEVVR
jgi:hypothetical protein